jgi:hypothetical protein
MLTSKWKERREGVLNTNWWCSMCLVPLYRNVRGREYSCYDEHIFRMDDVFNSEFTVQNFTLARSVTAGSGTRYYWRCSTIVKFF